MSASLMPMPKMQFWGVTGSYTGIPLAGGLIYTCIPGGTIGQIQLTYTDSTATTANPSPVVLDSNGMANIWLIGYYKIFVYDANSVLQYTVDNVSSGASSSTGTAQWSAVSYTLAYISATQFTAAGSYAATFPVGTRIQAVVTSGTIYGTVTAVSVGGSPVLTTVTVLWDSTGLDAGLSAVAVGIITITSGSLPVLPIVSESGNYSFLKTDYNQTFKSTSAANTQLTLPAAANMASGSWLKIKNANAGVVTLVGTSDGIANQTLQPNDEVTIFSDGTNLYGKPITTPLLALRDRFRNLVAISNNTNAIPMTADEIILQNSNGYAMRIPLFTATANIASAAGINALDTGVAANGTFYHLWCIASSNGANGSLLSVQPPANAANLTLPANYTYTSWMGSFLWTTANNFIASIQNDNKVSIGPQLILSAGTNTTGLAFSFGNVVPVTAKKLYGYANSAGNTVITTISTNAALLGTIVIAQIATTNTIPFNMPLTTANSLFYKVSANQINLFASGWEY
jgi:hypothetical protein